MKSLQVPRVAFPRGGDLTELGKLLDREASWGTLDQLNWPSFPYEPKVRFGIAHSGASIYLKYRVDEQAVIAEKTLTNSQVSEDSCVELFIAPGKDDVYYNFEWSCIGTCLVGAGTERHGRTFVEPGLIERVRRASSLGSSPFGERSMSTEWSIVVEIPVSVLSRHTITDLSGLRARGNFYKCGDHLTTPHYVTWSPIKSPAPDYHRPEQFGDILFSE
ncbi:MAG TPA: carbohydrate-binding family 9-like protein [Spirochaetia bacterium]|nr:carbohydrate-binding family 9-like protein [Spirochaetia bacterium]